MNPEIKTLWVAELRNPNRKQGVGRLRDSSGAECCLGVLCDLAADAGITRWEDGDYNEIRSVSISDRRDWSAGSLPEAVAKWAGFGDEHDPVVNDPSDPESGVLLSALNDSGCSFGDIASLIERDL